MTEVAVKTYPVMEVFGPVVQGEGPLAGQVTHFVRFGLCDYRCSWCDSMFAVEPEEVKAHAERLDVSSIVERLEWLDLAPWVTLSGGNPAVHDLGPLVKELRETLGLDVAVETQGSRWRDWLADVDLLIVSPKPPSSGMVNEKYSQQTATFMDKAMFRLNSFERCIKIVVFDDADLEWADEFLAEHSHWPRRYLSVGTSRPFDWETLDDTRRMICERYRWLCEKAPYLRTEVTVLPQLHVLAYGHARGV